MCSDWDCNMVKWNNIIIIYAKYFTLSDWLKSPGKFFKKKLQPAAKLLRHSLEYDLSCFKSLLVTGLWDITLTSLLPAIQSWTSKFWVWSCIANNFDKGWRGDHRDKIMDRPFMPKYGTVSRVLWQLVVASTKFGKIFTDINTMEVNCIDIDRKKRGNKKAMFLPKRKPDIKVDVIFAVKQTI